jgi:hypothetical protein
MLGRLHVSDLMQKYQGNQTLVSAAYNAGEGRVDGWLKSIGDPRQGIISNADFAAQIPLAETKNYVMRVAQPSAIPTTAGGINSPQGYAPPSPGTPQHSPLPYDAEADMVTRAWQEAHSRFPDRPDMQKAMVQPIYEQIQQMNALQAKDQAERMKAQRDAQEDAGQTVVKQLMTDPAKFDVSTIANNPALSYEQKVSLWKLAESHLSKSDDHDTKTYGQGFYSLFQSVHAPEGDPNRITDPSALWSHVGPNGDLTVSGVDKLTQEIQSRRTPEGESEGEMRKQFLATAKQEISGRSELYHMRDPKGDELFLKFMATALPQYDAGRRSGKTAAQLLNPDSSDYVGKSIKSFVRPQAEWLRDTLSANEPLDVGDKALLPPAARDEGTATPAGPDLTTKEGIVSAYQQGRLSRAAAGAALLKGGFAVAPPAAPAPPSAPVN